MNKQKVLFYTVLAASLTFLVGCFDPPEFSEVPEIKFKNIRFVEVENALDTLMLSFEFQDGDGDLGLVPEIDFAPYQPFWQVEDNNGDFVFFGEPADSVALPLFIVNPLNLSQRSFYSDTYTPLPYNCKDWFIRAEPFQDTVLIVENEWNKNIRIDIFRKIGGEYIFINDQLSAGDCTEDFDARIPIFDLGNVIEERPISGVINYALLSQAFIPVFRNDTMKFEFYIYDLALNRSNIAETPDFVLNNIR